MPLTDMLCRNAKPKAKPYKIFDGGGLYLEVMPTGSQHWRLKYRIHDKEKRLSLGPYPLTSLSEAREKRDKAKKSIERFVDPSLERKEEKRIAKLKAAQTFELVAREWHTRHYTTWSQRHADAILYRLEREVFPRIGHLPLTSITPPIIHACIQKIEDRGAQEMARRALQMCGQVFRYGVVTGRVDTDMTRDLKGSLKKFIRGHYASIEVDELPDLIKKINKNDARLFKQTILALKMMMLTFVRTRELIDATWDEFDFDKAVWSIPAHRMKMREPHVVPLAKQTVEILHELHSMNGRGKYVFPSIPRPNKPMSNCTILGGLKRLGYNGKMTGHGFRSLAMSAIKEKLSYQHEVVDRQLAHLPRNVVDKAYDRAKFLPQRKQMMQDWADYIDNLQKDQNETAGSQ